MLNREFLNRLTPVEIQLLNAYIGKLFKKKITPDTKNVENLKGGVTACPHCGYKRIVRNGHEGPANTQKYVCKNPDCKKTFSDSTCSFFFHSKASYETWITFIGCEIVGASLKEEAVITGVSKTGCFHMRHKLYDALRDFQNEQPKLKGLCEVDANYQKINLKGTRPNNMPRLSKRRGKHKPYEDNPGLRGISHHKICIVSAIDEYDHILMKIAGLGPESLKKYDQIKERFGDNCTIVCDSKPDLVTFAQKIGRPDVIAPNNFKSHKGNTLASLNQVHQELSELIVKKHGVSVRHLQGYLDWIVYTKELKYQIEVTKMRSDIYMQVMHKKSMKNEEILNKPLPIDLYEAYGEYHYGIFDPIHRIT